jgi:hypothetical protein
MPYRTEHYDYANNISRSVSTWYPSPPVPTNNISNMPTDDLRALLKQKYGCHVFLSGFYGILSIEILAFMSVESISGLLAFGLSGLSAVPFIYFLKKYWIANDCVPSCLQGWF